MKGMVFTEFLEMVEAQFGMELVDRILTTCQPASGGSYTSIGTYDHNELVALVQQLSIETKMPVPTLLQAFGRFLFARFVEAYPPFFQGVTSCFQFLETVDSYVHVEVLKLYPEAELPSFTSERLDADRLAFEYRSRRPFADLAEGLIEGCAHHYGETIHIQREPLAAESGTAVRFLIQRTN